MKRNTTPAAPAPVDVLTARLAALEGRMTELVEVTRGNLVNHVLFSGSRIIPAAGFVTLEFQVPMASVALGVLKGTGNLTGVAGPPGDAAAPVEGPGVIVAPAGWHVVAPMAGVTLTVWGTVGDTAHIVALTRLVPPSAGAGGAIGGTP